MSDMDTDGREELTDDELLNQLGDIGAIIGRMYATIADVRRAQTVLKHEGARRGLSVRAVSDHAVIRYLERHKSINIEAMRIELRAMADEAIPTKDGEHHWHEGTDTILVIGEDAQIITVLSPDQIEKWRGRKLKNGNRIRSEVDTTNDALVDDAEHLE